MNEFDWIARYFAPLADASALGLKDDAALLTPAAGKHLVVTTDALVESRHFLSGMEPSKLAQKALAVNLSDLAAMGATPRGYTLAIGVDDSVTESWTQSFAHGLQTMQELYGIKLLGGDTVKAQGGLLFLCITALGEVPLGKALQRNAALEGDDIYVSGTIGNGWRGLQMLQGNMPYEAMAVAQHETPIPRLELGQALQQAGIRCAVDVSDGLLSDTGHIATASGLTARLSLPLIPVASPSQVLEQISGGDDYELVFTASPDSLPVIKSISHHLDISLTRIGTMEKHGSENLILENAAGEPVKVTRKGFTHF